MILKDFYCDGCDQYFEDYLKSGDSQASCPECSQWCDPVIGAPRIGLYHDQQSRSAALKQRSHDHTMKELSREPERFGFEAAKRLQRWNLRK